MDAKNFNNRLAGSLNMTPRQTSGLTEALAEIFQEAARTLTSVAVPSFGTFVPVKRDEEVVTDRSTGRRMLLPPQITVEFQPAAMLRKKLNSHE